MKLDAGSQAISSLLCARKSKVSACESRNSTVATLAVSYRVTCPSMLHRVL